MSLESEGIRNIHLGKNAFRNAKNILFNGTVLYIFLIVELSGLTEIILEENALRGCESDSTSLTMMSTFDIGFESKHE